MPSIVPSATYRLQLTSDFGFDAAAALVPYLHTLGISHVYTSPFTQARPGSTHGYDVIDHNRLSDELGGENGFARLSAELARYDMGLILDFVPNHMAASPNNPWWFDVLRHGRQSRYSMYFDITWQRPSGFRFPAVTLPILGKAYGQVLADCEIGLETGSDHWTLVYYDHRLPVSAAGEDFIHRHGAHTSASDPRRLHRLLQLQHYRLMNWRNAASEINYRRFFDINDLVGLRVEEPAVFADIHKLVRRLAKSGQLHGIRLDHIDGLHDPAGYCAQLNDLLATAAARPTYVLVEKILGPEESLAQLPGVSGTTGYEWANLLSGCFVHEPGHRILNRFWRDTFPNDDPLKARRDVKIQVMTELFSGELAALVCQLHRLAESHWASSDLSMADLRHALIAYIVELPVYRTYVTSKQLNEADTTKIENAISAARLLEPSLDSSIFDFLEGILTLRLADTQGYSRRRMEIFVLRLQQFTGPIMAKAIEDTLFYRDVRLLAFNEVGGEPTASAVSKDEFHRRMAVRISERPHGLTTTSTHDAKRGEDARLRIAALSEISENWTAAVRRWMAASNGECPTRTHEYLIYQSLIGAWEFGGPSADLISRMQTYAVKAARESNTETSWLHPNPSYEDDLQSFIAGVLDPRISPIFLSEFEPLARRASLLGALYSLGQVILKATMPGVADFYQGSEFWDLSLVDPDNRRPVDFAARADVMTASHSHPDWRPLSQTWQSGVIKLILTRIILALRGAHASLFTQGDYAGIPVHDDTNGTTLAFRRSHDNISIVVAVCTKFAAISRGGRDWPDFSKMSGFIHLPIGMTFSNMLNGSANQKSFNGTALLKDLFGPLPVAILFPTRR